MILHDTCDKTPPSDVSVIDTTIITNANKLSNETLNYSQFNIIEKENTTKDINGIIKIIISFIKCFGLLICLYLFVCSLDLLSNSLQLLNARNAGSIFSYNFFTNPIVGLMLGIIVTVIVQSSSTSTSIVVGLVSAGYIPSIPVVIPIIMGANVGTSVTNTLVATTRISNLQEFARAFTGATIHDMFNWLSVIIFLPLEVATGYLYHLTEVIMDSMHLDNITMTTTTDIKLLKTITDPLTKSILMLDKKVLMGITDPNTALKYENSTVLKIWCSEEEICPSLFSYFGLSDQITGIIMVILSLVLLIGCLIAVVKLLNHLLNGPMALILKKYVNADIPYVPWLTGYIAILFGAIATFLMQSSSVFTSALTPFVGAGIINIDRVYPLTLGSNIGTTTTAILAALTASPDKLRDTLQVAFCHLFFNLSGIIIFYPIPFMRWPILLATTLGKYTAKYKWFAFAYLITSFIIIPLSILSISIADPSGIALLIIGIPIIILILIILILNCLQNKFPHYLPNILKNWKWLPIWLRSLQPFDNLFRKIFTCCKCCFNKDDDEIKGETNYAYNNEDCTQL